MDKTQKDYLKLKQDYDNLSKIVINLVEEYKRNRNLYNLDNSIKLWYKNNIEKNKPPNQETDTKRKEVASKLSENELLLFGLDVNGNRIRKKK